MSSRSDFPWLVQKGEMGAAIAAHPWEKTPLGPLAGWPTHLRTVVNLMLGSHAPIALIWGPDFRFLYNDSYAQIIQDKHPAALGRPGADIFPESAAILIPLFQRALGGEPIVSEDYELKITRQGATAPAYFSFSYNPVFNESGVPEGFLALVVENTTRVLREQARATVFDTVLSTITDFAYTFDLAGRFIYVNKALLDLWGLPLAAATGKNFFDLQYPAELAGRLQSQIQQVIDTRKMVRDETPYVSPTGVAGFYEYIFQPVFSPDGAVVQVAGSTREITDRKKLEVEALAASRAKDAFLATLSHELRTPLTPVLLLATEAAENPATPPELHRILTTIVEHISTEARLIDDLLDITRITHGKLALKLGRHDLHELLHKALESLGAELRAKHLSVAMDLAPGGAPIPGDDVRLQQVFANLLGNAIKFSPPGSTITLRTRSHPDKPEILVLDVIDQGHGLSARELATIFEPFAQGEHSTEDRAQFGGLGLGLTISRKIAELHDGGLTASSAGRGQGATFSLHLPRDLASVPAASPGRGTSAPVETESPFERSRILLVEDHKGTRDAVGQILQRWNLEIVQCASGAEALAQAAGGKFDLVISDLGLPDTTGHDLMKTLQSTYGLRGIALSGYGSQSDIDQSNAAGFAVHLVKPIQIKALRDAIRRLDKNTP